MHCILRNTITEIFLARARATPRRVGFQFKPSRGTVRVMGGEVGVWKELTFQEFFEICRVISLGLMELGTQPGDSVALLSSSRVEWPLVDMAILGARGVTVPIYPSNTSSDVMYILNHSDAHILVLEDEKQLLKILEGYQEKPESLAQLKKIIVLDPDAVNKVNEHPVLGKLVMTFEALRELGQSRIEHAHRFEENLVSAQPEDLMTICYTSGTTGVPKGVCITHDNFASVLEDCVTLFQEDMRPEQEVTLSFLPFSHVIGKVESLVIHTFGWKQVFAESLDQLMNNLLEVRPTILFAVPRIFEKFYHRVFEMIDQASLVQKILFKQALKIGRRYCKRNQKQLNIKLFFEYQIVKYGILRKISQRFGGRLRFALCGGAPLSVEMAEFFKMIGIHILEGYGLTETSAPVTLNTPQATSFGTVGKPLPEVSIKIAFDGEILLRSRKLFRSYHKMEAETQEAYAEGWFHTGDIGLIDSEGFLHITDRKKDLIITSGGKNVAPQKIEKIAKNHNWITQFFVYGDRRPYLTALITLDVEQVKRYAHDQQILYSSYAELIKNQVILARVQKEIDAVNSLLASYETIKKFVLLEDEFSVEGGLLTPSLKLRRKPITERYARELASMYPATEGERP